MPHEHVLTEHRTEHRSKKNTATTIQETVPVM